MKWMGLALLFSALFAGCSNQSGMNSHGTSGQNSARGGVIHVPGYSVDEQ